MTEPKPLTKNEREALQASGVAWCSESSFSRYEATVQALEAERDALREALYNLLRFDTELCEEVNIGINHPSMLAARQVLA